MTDRTVTVAVPGVVVRAAIVGVVGAIVLFIYFAFLPSLGVTSDAGVLLGLLLILAVALGGATVVRAARAGNADDAQAVLIATSPWLPAAFAVVAVGMLLLDQSAPFAISVAAIATAVGWLAFGFMFKRLASVSAAHPRNHAELVDRLKNLQAERDEFATDDRIEDLKDEEKQYASLGQRQLAAILPSISDDLGMTEITENGVKTTKPARSGSAWVTGAGYLELWNRIHRAEEAMFFVAPPEKVISSATFDRLRLRGSNIGNRKDLIAQLDGALQRLNRNGITSKDQVTARDDLRTIRRTINTYRDELWDKILRQRNQLLRTMVLTGITADGVLALVLLAGAERTVVVGAAAFYLVGAVIGLFSRLRAESEANAVVDDYGLSDARLIVTPLLSGLGALAGVVLTAKIILPVGDVVAPASVDDSGKVTTVAADVREPASLRDIFDIELNPAGLLVAAIFGLTPTLALDRLQKESERYKTNLQASGAADSESEDDKAGEREAATARPNASPTPGGSTAAPAKPDPTPAAGGAAAAQANPDPTATGGPAAEVTPNPGPTGGAGAAQAKKKNPTPTTTGGAST